MGEFAPCPEYLLVLLWSQGFCQVAVVCGEFLFPAGVGEIEVLRAAEKSHFCERCALLGRGVYMCVILSLTYNSETHLSALNKLSPWGEHFVSVCSKRGTQS